MGPTTAPSAAVAASLLLLLLLATDGANGMDRIELSGRVMELAKHVDKKCREETGSDRESLKKYIHGILDDHESFKCYIKCIMMELRALSEEGVFVVEEELENVPPEIKEEGHRIVLACQHTTGADVCDAAYQMHRCYNATNPTLYKQVLTEFDFKIEED